MDPLEMLALDSLLSEEERAMRAVVRRAVDEYVRPHMLVHHPPHDRAHRALFVGQE